MQNQLMTIRASFEDEKSKIAEKKDVLEFQFNEINELDLKENEDNELEKEYKKIGRAHV